MCIFGEERLAVLVVFRQGLSVACVCRILTRYRRGGRRWAGFVILEHLDTCQETSR